MNHGERLNAAAPLTIPTPDDVGSPIHPGIVHLDQPLGGYTYWMAFTPYPNWDDRLENPCIVASNNGIDWVVPAGLTNPLDPVVGDPPMVIGSHYNSDTDIAHVDGTLYLFWRRFNNSYATIYVRTSTDGVNWTPRQVVHDGVPHQEGVVSPFFHHDGTTWHMWYGHGTFVGLRYRTAPSVTGPWSPVTECPITDLDPWRWLWHFDAVRHDDDVNGEGGLYVGLFNSTQRPATNIRGVLYLAASRDGITWRMGPCILGPTSSAPGFSQRWDGDILYRSTLLVEDGTIRIWYTGLGGGSMGIGYTEAPLSLLSTALDALSA